MMYIICQGILTCDETCIILSKYPPERSYNNLMLLPFINFNNFICDYMPEVDLTHSARK